MSPERPTQEQQQPQLATTTKSAINLRSLENCPAHKYRTIVELELELFAKLCHRKIFLPTLRLSHLINLFEVEWNSSLPRLLLLKWTITKKRILNTQQLDHSRRGRIRRSVRSNHKSIFSHTFEF